MLVNHVANASKGLTAGWKTKKGISTCVALTFRSPLVGGGLTECRRHLTRTRGVLPTSRFLTSDLTSSASRPILTNEWRHQQILRYLTVDRSPLIYVTRSVVFEDIQMYKMVHGGIYLSVTEEAGELAVKKYCSETQIPQYLTAVPSLTRIEKTLFLGSATLDDVLEAEAEIIYTSPQSLRVLVCLYASPVVRSKTRKSISKSWAWYELLKGGKSSEVLPVPPLEMKDARLEEEGRLEHEAFMADKQRRQNVNTVTKMEYSGLTSVASTQILDSSSNRASPILKYMDEQAGLSAHHYTQAKCLTGSGDDINVFSRLIPGCFVTVTTAVVFTSSKTVDVQCSADVEKIQDGRVTKERAAEACFTFVVRSTRSNQPATIRQFTPQTEFEKEIHERRMKVYQKRKQNSKDIGSK